MLNNSPDVYAHSNLLDDIPLIDLQPVVRDNNPAIIAEQIINACKNHGFFYIINHGIDDDLVSKHTLNMKKFFNLPLDEKLKLDVRHSDAHRGYFPIYAENNDPQTSLDLKEGFDVMAENNLYDEHVIAKKPFYGPNQWPDNIDGFRENTTRYYEAMTVLSMLIMETIAVGLNLPQKYFSNKLDGPFAMLRMLHYPHQSVPVSSREVGTGAHTDYGLITILFQDENEGLQIKSPNEGWINVKTIPGTFVVNIGDELQRWSNDVLKSNLHRVINISGNDRYSSPFFFHAAYDTVIDCLPSCENSNKLTNYTPITAGELMWQRIRATFAHHKDL